MTDVAVAVATGLVAVALILAGVVAYHRFAWRAVVRREVLVVAGEAAVRGILYARRGPLLILRNASTSMQGRDIPMDGEVVIERRTVTWIQVLP